LQTIIKTVKMHLWEVRQIRGKSDGSLVAEAKESAEETSL